MAYLIVGLGELLSLRHALIHLAGQGAELAASIAQSGQKVGQAAGLYRVFQVFWVIILLNTARRLFGLPEGLSDFPLGRRAGW
ncbi:MAG: hypothetical protein JKX92_04505 [Porticoccaceae bacterium]|nr:hypothetical protein [Porticoccaceae bacterium]